MDVETIIKDSNMVNNVTSVNGLVNVLTKQGLKCNVIKTNSKNLTDLYNIPNINIILHMSIENNYHYGHVKKIKKYGILFNNDLFIRFEYLKNYYTGISIIVTNESFLNINCSCDSVDKSEWVNITGKLTQRELFNLNYGLIGKSITLNNKYVKLKSNIKDEKY